MRLAFAVGAIGAAAIGTGAGASSASAHTEADYAAVSAGEEITVHFAPTHGCSGSPTTAVSVRVPAPGATAGDVEGFTSSAEADGDRTILRWTGGLLPAEQEGEFPITFTVPDTVGELLLFPTVQTCEVGEVAWIDGDPEGEHPAVRMLVLPAGSEPARDVDEVPADAPGRELLTSIVDVDNPAGVTTVAPATTVPATTAVTTAPSVTTAVGTTTGAVATTSSAPDSTAPASATTAPATTDAAPTTSATDDDEDSSNAGTIVFIVVVAVVVLGAAAAFLLRRRQTGS